MQFCDFSQTEAHGAKAEIDRLLQLGFLLPSDAALADPRAIDMFFTSELYQEMKMATTIYREHRFMISLPCEEFADDPGAIGEELLVQGVIDCFFLDEKGRIHLVDYKTDTFPKNMEESAIEQTLLERHGKQMHYYTEALRRLCGKEVYRASIYSFHLNRAISIPNDMRKDLL